MEPTYDLETLATLANFRLEDPETSDPGSNVLPDLAASQSWTTNPLVHLAVVGALAGAVSLGLAHFAGDIFQKTDSTSEEAPANEPSQETVQESDSGQIKSELAFGAQSEDLAALNAAIPSAVEADSLAASATSTTSPTAPTPPPAVTPVRPAVSTRPAPAVSPPTAPTPIAAAVIPRALPEEILNRPSEPALTVESPEESSLAAPTVTVTTGTRVRGILVDSLMVASDLAIRGLVQLSEPLVTTTGTVALPAETVLIAEVSQNGLSTDTVYLQITGYILNGAEISLPVDAVVALGPAGPLQNPNPVVAEQNGLDLEQILLTGAISSLGIDSNDFLGGVALDLLGQLAQQDTTRLQAALQQPNTWVIPAGTEVVVHVNQAITVPT